MPHDPNGPTENQHRLMHALWHVARVADRADRLALTRAVVQRPLKSSAELTEEEATRVIRYMHGLQVAGRLEREAQAWLARNRTATHNA